MKRLFENLMPVGRSVIAFWLNNLLAAIHAGFQVDVVTELVFARMGIFLIVNGLESIM